MGYNTKFEGEFRLDKPLDDDTYYELAGLDGPFSESDGFPSMWCQWVVGNDWQSIIWNGDEKFYGYVGWIRHINDKFLTPRGYVLSGTVAFQGEDLKDSGRIVATDGKIEVFWNYDDSTLSNYDRNAENGCHIPEGQGVSWIDENRRIFCDVADLLCMGSEEEISEQNKLLGITIGNPEALAVLVDISAEAGTDKDWLRREADGLPPGRVRVMSLDMFLPLIDGERGARTRIMQLVFAGKKQMAKAHGKTMLAIQTRTMSPKNLPNRWYSPTPSASSSNP